MEEINKVVHEAFEIIEKGGIILYPTDTVWGLGCDATNEEAVKRIYELKRREEQKSMIVLVNGDRLLYNTFQQIPEVAFDIWDHTNKPTTLILDNPKNIAKNLIAPDNSLGVRMVKSPFIFKLIERMKKPLVSTSANISGFPTPNNFAEIDYRIISAVDYVVPLEQDKKCNKPSTIIKLQNDLQVKIIRK
ncbi:L-threonylcarbamoyladenylate synthase [Avrilella dinanensis]|uniref:L-threonylcarbamoyladenylate synthase n=1 Tax=Avrilella dinanensis TaxID=2008672 RepID=UPI00240959CE|nr:L-threonylcarbamoyladenylate synthase [Avrilella dinanensis]